MDQTLQHILGARVRAIRKDNNLTKTEFALRLGISRVTLNVIERGDGNIKLSTLASLAAKLGVEPWELIK